MFLNLNLSRKLASNFYLKPHWNHVKLKKNTKIFFCDFLKLRLSRQRRYFYKRYWTARVFDAFCNHRSYNNIVKINWKYFTYYKHLPSSLRIGLQSDYICHRHSKILGEVSSGVAVIAPKTCLVYSYCGWILRLAQSDANNRSKDL